MALADEMQALLDRMAAAYTAGDARACAALFTEDGAIYSPFGPPVQGRAAIEAAHREWIALGETKKRLSVVEARASGDLAWCLAAFAGDVPDGAGGTRTERGVSLNVLERQPGGAWLIRVSSLNEDAPPASG